MRRIGLSQGIHLLPNLCTTANLFCGFFSVVKALSGSFVHAAVALLFAGVFDFLDGRLARLTKSQSDFGVEYDSLVDLASFGLAPGILIYTWNLSQFGRLGWLVTFLYFACGALRLARYNVQVASVERRHFQGLPIPAAAGTLASLVIFCHYHIGPIEQSLSVLILTAVLSLLMVSNVRYWSSKGEAFTRRQTFNVLILSVIVLFLIALKPTIALLSVGTLYVLSGPILALFDLRRKPKEPKLTQPVVKVVNFENRDT